MLGTDTMQSFSTVDVFQQAQPNSVLAMIVGMEGPSYRPLGAVMRFFSDGSSIGTLSSGCIEADLWMHAQEALQNYECRILKYGRGSPFADIQLPCGGGLEIILVPRPNENVLSEIAEMLKDRVPVTISIDFASGNLECWIDKETTRSQTGFSFRYIPEPRLIVFGKGPEAATFTALAETLNYQNILLSPDKNTLRTVGGPSEFRQHMTAPKIPLDLKIDKWSAIILFFHDHDWEPKILHAALKSNAFYIGAQGSQRAREEREVSVIALGASHSDAARIKGPIGLIPSARDPRTLAVSVLAEVLKEHKDGE